MDLQSIMRLATSKKASDIHIVAEYYPTLRINNKLLFLRDLGICSITDANKLPQLLLNKAQQQLFEENHEIDFSYSFEDMRFRVNLYMAKGACAASFRTISNIIKTVGELQLPDIIESFVQYKQGLILFTGPTGEGKSTSLAALINQINNQTASHIITIEDPIEYTYPKAKSIISQRELMHDTYSWKKALTSALREDPDVVLVGEMRDFETIESALTLAETGHLVFSTLHTGSTPEAINRIVDVFPADQQNQIRSSLSSTLIAVVAQRLIPTVNDDKRIPAVEILMNKPSVASVIRDGKTHLLDNIIQTSEEEGMILFEKYLAQLYSRGFITKETAYAYAIRKKTIPSFIP